MLPPTLIEFLDMKSIDRDLDLLVRHVLAPRFGEDLGDVVLLTRPPTRILVAVDPEKRFKIEPMQERERQKLVDRLPHFLLRSRRRPLAQKSTP
jgi:hypothetical protein